MLGNVSYADADQDVSVNHYRKWITSQGFDFLNTQAIAELAFNMEQEIGDALKAHVLSQITGEIDLTSFLPFLKQQRMLDIKRASKLFQSAELKKGYLAKCPGMGAEVAQEMVQLKMDHNHGGDFKDLLAQALENRNVCARAAAASLTGKLIAGAGSLKQALEEHQIDECAAGLHQDHGYLDGKDCQALAQFMVRERLSKEEAL